jgi:hypothetical protein
MDGPAMVNPNQTTQLKHSMMADTREAEMGDVKPAQLPGFTISPLVLDCRLP